MQTLDLTVVLLEHWNELFAIVLCVFEFVQTGDVLNERILRERELLCHLLQQLEGEDGGEVRDAASAQLLCERGDLLEALPLQVGHLLQYRVLRVFPDALDLRLSSACDVQVDLYADRSCREGTPPDELL